MKHSRNLYASGAIQELADYYIENGGEVYEVVEGTLGWGTTIMTRHGWKSIVVKEVYVNEWNSGHTVRRYNSLPKKYEIMLGKMRGVGILRAHGRDFYVKQDLREKAPTVQLYGNETIADSHTVRW